MTRRISVIVIGGALLALLAGCGQKEDQTQVQETAQEVQVASAKVIDLVCGMKIDLEAAVKTEYEGKTYHFCSAECKEKFLANPKQYAYCKDHDRLHKGQEGHQVHCGRHGHVESQQGGNGH